MQASLSSYAEMHRQMLAGERPARVLLWTQRDGMFDGTHGIGNECLIFESLLLLGILSKRAVLFDLAKPWSKLVRSPYIEWDWQAVRKRSRWAARINASNPRLWRWMPRRLDLGDLDLEAFFDRDFEIFPHHQSLQRMEFMAGADLLHSNMRYPILARWFDSTELLRGCLWHALFGELSQRLLAALARRLHRLGPTQGAHAVGVHFSTGTNEARFLDRNRAECRARYEPPCRCLYDTSALYKHDWETEEEQDLCHVNDWNARASEGKLANYYALLGFLPQCLDGMFRDVEAQTLFLLSNDKPREETLALHLEQHFARRRTNVTLVRFSKENVVTKTDVETLEAALADNLLLASADIVVDGQAESTFVCVAGHIGLRGWRFPAEPLEHLQSGARVFEAFRTCENYVSEWPPMIAPGLPVYKTSGF